MNTKTSFRLFSNNKFWWLKKRNRKKITLVVLYTIKSFSFQLSILKHMWRDRTHKSWFLHQGKWLDMKIYLITTSTGDKIVSCLRKIIIQKFIIIEPPGGKRHRISKFWLFQLISFLILKIRKNFRYRSCRKNCFLSICVFRF